MRLHRQLYKGTIIEKWRSHDLVDCDLHCMGSHDLHFKLAQTLAILHGYYTMTKGPDPSKDAFREHKL